MIKDFKAFWRQAMLAEKVLVLLIALMVLMIVSMVIVMTNGGIFLIIFAFWAIIKFLDWLSKEPHDRPTD